MKENLMSRLSHDVENEVERLYRNKIVREFAHGVGELVLNAIKAGDPDLRDLVQAITNLRAKSPTTRHNILARIENFAHDEAAQALVKVLLSHLEKASDGHAGKAA